MSSILRGRGYSVLDRHAWWATNAGAQVLSAVSGMVTNILYARLLNLSDIGVIALANAIAALGSVVVDRGFGTWLTRELSSRPASTREIYWTACKISLFPFGVVAAVAAALWIFGTNGFISRAAIASLPLLLCLWFYQLGISICQGRRLAGIRSAGVAMNGVLTLILTAAFVHIWPSPDVATAVSAVAYLICAGWLVVMVRPSEREEKGSDRPLQRSAIVAESRPFFVSNLAVFALSSGDAIGASLLLSPADVGLYQLSKKISQGLVLPAISVLPVLFGKFMVENAGQRVSRCVKISVLISCLVSTVGLALRAFGSTIFNVFFGHQLASIGSILAILAIAFGFQFVKDLWCVLLNSLAIDRRVAIINLSTALLFVLIVCSIWLMHFHVSLVVFCFILMCVFSFGALISSFSGLFASTATKLQMAIVFSVAGLLWILGALMFVTCGLTTGA